MAQQKTQIEYVPVDDLKSYERNARTHSDEQVKQVAESSRKARAMELDPRYCDVIIKRWQDLTGEDAVREDGVTFNDCK